MKEFAGFLAWWFEWWPRPLVTVFVVFMALLSWVDGRPVAQPSSSSPHVNQVAGPEEQGGQATAVASLVPLATDSPLPTLYPTSTPYPTYTPYPLPTVDVVATVQVLLATSQAFNQLAMVTAVSPLADHVVYLEQRDVNRGSVTVFLVGGVLIAVGCVLLLNFWVFSLNKQFLALWQFVRGGASLPYRPSPSSLPGGVGGTIPQPWQIPPQSAPLSPQSAPLSPQSAPLSPQSAPLSPQSAPSSRYSVAQVRALGWSEADKEVVRRVYVERGRRVTHTAVALFGYDDPTTRRLIKEVIDPCA